MRFRPLGRPPTYMRHSPSGSWGVLVGNTFYLRTPVRNVQPIISKLTLLYLYVVISVFLPSYYDIFNPQFPPKKNCPCFWTICQVFSNFFHSTPVSYNIFLRFSHPKILSPLLKSHFLSSPQKTPPLLKNIRPDT